ncbi:MAG: primosomal protein N' [Candidatus Omnitrophota bacterium]|nr:primosomal protein N' [Candidatus Omnitrophota bacterium]
MTKKRIAKIAIGLPLKGPLHYRVPEGMANDIKVGQRVWVPFRNRRLIGYIVGFLAKSDIRRLKNISEMIDTDPVLNPDLLKLTKWMSEYYFCSWGEAIEAAIPGPLRKGKVKIKTRMSSSEEACLKTLDLRPNEEQQQVLNLTFKAVSDNQFNVFLLFGIAASGKTEIYLQAIRHAVKQGKSAIVLVPEISLTPQTVEHFKSRFGDKVAVFHSHLSPGERFRQWQNLKDGKAAIVIGTRSAVFSPVKRLGIVIVDEEHENSYKQDDSPRYHARDAAIARAKISQAVVILGSATPSLESYYKAKKGVYKLVTLKSRIKDAAAPSTRIVDMRKEISPKGKTKMFSHVLGQSISARLAKDETVMLFLNRRGFSTFVNCKNCGYVLKCKSCHVPLTYHFHKDSLICHYCGYQQKTGKICPQCKKGYLSYFGIGTQKVESEVARIFPQADISRMDTDSVKRKGSHQRILGEFKKGKVNILVGTQMIAKGLHLPRVTLVGVVSADMTLNLPDFRSSERTFQLLTQVAGRAGRGLKKGEVVIQTYNPDNYSIRTASQYDFDAFYNQEIISRKELEFPPYCHLVNLIFRGSLEKSVIKTTRVLAKMLRKTKPKGIKIIGPASLPLPKLRGNFRWHIMFKSKEIALINKFLHQELKKFKPASGVIFKVDVDPMNML